MAISVCTVGWTVPDLAGATSATLTLVPAVPGDNPAVLLLEGGVPLSSWATTYPVTPGQKIYLEVPNTGQAAAVGGTPVTDWSYVLTVSADTLTASRSIAPPLGVRSIDLDVDAVVAVQVQAGGATTTATDAQATADAAVAAASAAQTTAASKSRIIRSTAAASSPGSYAAGDQWWRYSGADVVGFWLHSGTGWVAQTISPDIIANTLTGKTIRTAPSGERVEISQTSGGPWALRFFDALGQVASMSANSGTLRIAGGVESSTIITSQRHQVVQRNGINTEGDWSLSFGEVARFRGGEWVPDPVMITVANATARAQKVAALAAASPPYVPSPARPMYVHRQDAAPGFELEVTTNGTSWRPVASGLLQPYGGQGLHMRVTSAAPTTNSNGDASISIPGGGFPTALAFAFLQYAAPNAATGYGAITPRWMPDLSSRTSLAYRLYGGTGSPVASTAVQISALLFGY